jgi:predicted O-methyltransferase YrrM
MDLQTYVKSVWPPMNTAKNYKTILEYYSNDRDSEKYGRSPHNGILILDLIRNYLGSEEKTYLEIGVMFGSSLGLMLMNETETKCIGVDLFDLETYKNIENPYNCSIEKVKPIIDDFNIFDREYHLVKGDSTDLKTIERVKNLIPNGCDILFIDGNHGGDYPLFDFNNYSKLVNPGGFIVFDDYMTFGAVKESIDKIKKEVDLKEFEFLGMIAPFYNEYVIKRL